MKVAYLDTSAIVKRYVEEPGSEVVSGHLQQGIER